MRKILITNDDGIGADGIIRLAKVAKEYGQVYVVAPESQRSAMSHSITLRHPVVVRKEEFPVEGVVAYSCSGTPADCVRVGSLNIMKEKPDVVISGINLGYNCATDIQYSATAGAAFEGAFLGYRSIAISEGFEEKHPVTDKYLRVILDKIIDSDLEWGQIWNVNFPDCSLDNMKEIRFGTKVSRCAYFKDTYKEEVLEDGSISLSVNGHHEEESEEGTDLRAIYENCISVGVASNIH